jgi:hypothetical protein
MMSAIYYAKCRYAECHYAECRGFLLIHCCLQMMLCTEDCLLHKSSGLAATLGGTCPGVVAHL